MGPQSIISEEDSISIRRELISEIDVMISETNNNDRIEYLKKIKNALQCNSLMHEFYWDTDELPQFKTLKKYNCCMATNCVFFRNDKYGIWADISNTLYNKRKVVKKEMLDAETDLEALKHTNMNKLEAKKEYKRLSLLISRKNTEQLGIKIALNSLNI